MRLDGKVAIVTGAGGGIGRAEALIKDPATAPAYLLPDDEPGGTSRTSVGAT